jgi:hypothetical protein
MIADTRFSKYFTVDARGDHLGLFDCSSDASGGNKLCSESGACC